MLSMSYYEEDVIDNDYEEIIFAYVVRNIELGLRSRMMIRNAIAKFQYDGAYFYYVDESQNTIARSVDNVKLGKFIRRKDIEGFYRYLNLDELTYLGY
jgi:hypothetical protein